MNIYVCVFTCGGSHLSSVSSFPSKSLGELIPGASSVNLPVQTLPLIELLTFTTACSGVSSLVPGAEEDVDSLRVAEETDQPPSEWKFSEL